MTRQNLIFLFREFVLLMALSLCYSERQTQYIKKQKFSLLLNFTCATAKDELEKHPEMRTIAMVELENNFPSEFSREVLKCLPVDVAKVIINPHKESKHSIHMPKETLIVYLMDTKDYRGLCPDYDSVLYRDYSGIFTRQFPVIHHLSKFMIVSTKNIEINEWKRLPNVVQIYQINRKVIARSFDMGRNLTTFETFESSQRENLSQILFPDKTKNFHMNVILVDNMDVIFDEAKKPIHKWSFFFDIIVDELGMTLNYMRLSDALDVENLLRTFMELQEKLDFFLNAHGDGKFGRLESYNNEGWCILAPVPEPYSITELILFLPMDKSCWMWLGITIAVSTLIWRISEGHWNFAFGAFSYFMGQAQLSVRIRTNRLTMKILLQLLIFTFFIFSNGYQSLVTSFMLEPSRVPLIKTIDELFESKLNFFSETAIDMQQKYPIKFQKVLDDGRISNKKLHDGRLYKQITENQMVVSQPCQIHKKRIEISGDGKNFNKVYQISDVLDSNSNDLYIRPFHPHLDKFQELMDRTFEAGLHQAWERFYWENWRKVYFNQTLPDPDIEILDIKLIAPFFLILVFGFGAALLALFCEIFWKDFVTELTGDYLKRKLGEIFGRQNARRRANRIQVQVKLTPKKRRRANTI